MYSRFGLPDEERDWELYFYGNETECSRKKVYSNNANLSKGAQETDLSEGTETMILIQELEAPQKVNAINEMLSNPSTESILVQEEPDSRFSIFSKSFLSGKYIIEENENGFFIVNNRTKNRMFLTKLKTLHGGTIIIRKEPDKKSFTIIKTLSVSTVHTAISRIVGTLNKEGLLLKFTAFDKSKINVTV